MSVGRRIILSCEHASNRVPSKYRKLFAGTPEVLHTHRAFDIGVDAIVRRMQKRLGCPFCRYGWTRLLVEVNRTQRTRFFSEYSDLLSVQEKQRVIDEFYMPYRNKLEGMVQKAVTDGPVLHVSMHSFTGELNGALRNADIGILYDPERKLEKQFAEQLSRFLKKQSEMRVKKNYPYRGNADGMTTWLRRMHQESQYLGIELELNQGMLLKLNKQQKAGLIKLLVEGIGLSA